MRQLLFVGLFLAAASELFAQVEYKVVTTIESVVPAGIGRSRIIMEEDEINYKDFTTERTDGKKSSQGDVKRSDAKIDNLTETKILNFYSAVGINFQNIASNDAMFTSMLNDMAAQGWDLFTVISGVESDAGKGDGTGIFITRYIFQRGK
jgi:hypothetical protein